MTLTAGTPARRRLTAEGIAMRAAVLALVAFLLLAIASPLATLLSKSVQDGEGRFVGLANYAHYFSTPSLVDSIRRSRSGPSSSSSHTHTASRGKGRHIRVA